MTRFIWMLLIYTGIILFSSCATSNDVASDGLIQKRKYRKGFFVNLPQRNIAKAGESYVDLAIENQSSFDLFPEKTKSESQIAHDEEQLLKEIASNEEQGYAKFRRSKHRNSEPQEIASEKGESAIENEPLEYAPSEAEIKRMSKVKWRGVLALTLALLALLAQILNFVLPFFIVSTYLQLFFVAFLVLAILTMFVGIPIRKRTDAAKWSVRLLWVMLGLGIIFNIIAIAVGLVVFSTI